jgi:hypothetical protein
VTRVGIATLVEHELAFSRSVVDDADASTALGHELVADADAGELDIVDHRHVAILAEQAVVRIERAGGSIPSAASRRRSRSVAEDLLLLGLELCLGENAAIAQLGQALELGHHRRRGR